MFPAMIFHWLVLPVSADSCRPSMFIVDPRSVTIYPSRVVGSDVDVDWSPSRGTERDVLTFRWLSSLSPVPSSLGMH